MPSGDSTGAKARCRAEWAVHEGPGLLLLSVGLPEGHRGQASLVLRRRGAAHDVRIFDAGLVFTEQGRVLQVPLRLSDAGKALLGEGVWDMYLRIADDEHRLASPQPAQQAWRPFIVPAVGTSIQVAPFATIRGNLSLRVEEVKPYAEVEDVDAAGGVLTLVGSFVGLAGPEEASARLVARRRDGDEEIEGRATATRLKFRATLELHCLPAQSETAAWDLFLLVDGVPPALRLGSRLDDVANKKTAVAFPRFQLAVDGRSATAEPFYTVANNLSVRVAPKPVAQPVEQTTGAAPTSQPKQHTPLGPHGKTVTGALLTVLEAAGRRRRTLASGDHGRPKVHFVITHVYGMGGTIRTVLNIANHLAEDHDVEIISAVRTREKPFFAIDPRVRVTTLLDETKIGPEGRTPGLRGAIRAWLDSKASWLVHEEDYAFQRYSLWLDLKLLRKLHSTRSGVLVTTRPSLNVTAARFAHPGVITIGQEHLNAGSHGLGLLRQIEQHYRKLDALAVLTEGDEQDYQRMLRGAPTRIARIGNALPETPTRRADLTSKRVVAAGRYTSQKGFDLLIPAFGQVADKHPDWQLRIFGGGRQLRRLRRMVADRGLHKHVLLMGQTDQLSHEMAKSSIYVLSSRFEGFGMVIIEAMSHGMGVVSFDCPRGPGDIITDGVDGTLVPAEDIDRLAAAIIELIEDQDKLRSYGEAALRRSKSYSIEVIGDQWRTLFRELARPR